MAKRRKKKESILSPRISWVLIWSQFSSVAINKLHLARLKERATPGFAGLKHEEHRYNGFRGTQPRAKVWLNSPVGAADKMKRGVSTEGSPSQNRAGWMWEGMGAICSGALLAALPERDNVSPSFGTQCLSQLVCMQQRGLSGSSNQLNRLHQRDPHMNSQKVSLLCCFLLWSRQKMLPAKRIYPVGEYLESSKTHNENLCVSIQEWYWQQSKVIKHTAPLAIQISSL